MDMKILLTATVSGLALTAGSAHAATITGVSIEDVSSEVINLVDRAAVHVIDGSGFNEVNGTHTVSDNGTTWTSAGKIAGEPGSLDPLPVFITFDLGDNYNLSSIQIWNFNTATSAGRNAGVKDMSVWVASSEGGSFSLLKTGVSLAKATGLATYTGENVGLTSGVEVPANNIRLIRFDITSNHGFNDSLGQLVALSEVRFDGTVVPEPGSLALLGLGGLCVLRRRRG